MAKETDVDRHLHVFPLYDIGVAAAAVKPYSARLSGKVGLMVKDDVPPCEIDSRLYQSPFMTSVLKAFAVGHVGKGAGIVSPQEKPKLARNSLHRSVFMTFQAGNHMVSRPLPLVIERLDKMTAPAYGRTGNHHFPQEKIADKQECHHNAYNIGQLEPQCFGGGHDNTRISGRDPLCAEPVG